MRLANASFWLNELYKISILTSSIPDKISTAELADILSEMQHEEDCKHNQEYCPNDIVDAAEKHLDAMIEEIEDPMVHKIAALMIMKRFVEWHSKVAENHLNQPESLAWAEDMGKSSLLLIYLLSYLSVQMIS